MLLPMLWTRQPAGREESSIYLAGLAAAVAE